MSPRLLAYASAVIGNSFRNRSPTSELIVVSCCRSDEVKISNFYGSDLTVRGYIANNRITIPLQQTEGYEIEGTGKMINGRLQITFFARDIFSYPTFTDFVDMEGWPY